MRSLIAILAAGLLAPVLAGTAVAQETLDEIESGKPAPEAPSGGSRAAEKTDAPIAANGKAMAEVNGYLDDRIGFESINPSRPVTTRDIPSISEIAEANLQLRVSLAGTQNFAYADLSLLYQSGWLFYADDGAGGRREVANHDVPALRPAVVPSELYLSLTPKPWLNLLAGKKRITWGSGFAFNPTDLINPPKDPTDPNAQRAGNWVMRVEAPFEKLTFTGLFAPEALYTQQGIPYAMLRYPSYPPADGPDVRDNASHYLLAARLYLLLGDADVNLIYYFSNRYQDGFQNESRWGVSFSRFFFTYTELHVEALFSRGSARSYPNHDCLTGAARCDDAALVPSKLNSSSLYPRLIAGARRQFSDESMLSLEYYYQRDGYSDAEFRDAVQLLALAKASGITSASSAGTSSALPQRFTFDPLRRHYLIASYSKPRIFDDWTVGVVLIAGLRDLSGLFTPSVTWSAREWLTFTLSGYVPIHGLGVGEAKVGNGSWSEYALTPFDTRVLFETRVFY